MPTVRCSNCSEWHHRPCVGFFDTKRHKFVCVRCQVSCQNVAKAGYRHIPLRQSSRYPVNYGENQEIDFNSHLTKDIATVGSMLGPDGKMVMVDAEGRPIQPLSGTSGSSRDKGKANDGGQQSDLDEAISLHRQALELQLPPHPN